VVSTFGEACELLGGLVDPEPDPGGAALELGLRGRGRSRVVEGPAAAAAGRRGGGVRRDVAARALDGGAELVGAVPERGRRGPRRAHGCRRRRIWIWAAASVGRWGSVGSVASLGGAREGRDAVGIWWEGTGNQSRAGNRGGSGGFFTFF
jgi:hypothetical protein